MKFEIFKGESSIYLFLLHCTVILITWCARIVGTRYSHYTQSGTPSDEFTFYLRQAYREVVAESRNSLFEAIPIPGLSSLRKYSCRVPSPQHHGARIMDGEVAKPHTFGSSGIAYIENNALNVDTGTLR